MTAMPLSIVPVFIGISLHLSGCASPLSPQAQCFADATVEYRAAWRPAEALRSDLDRGYALHRVETRQAEAVPCRVDGRLTTCLYDGRAALDLPAPIDRPATEARLAAAEARMDRLRPAAMERAAPCGYGDALAAEKLALAQTAPALP